MDSNAKDECPASAGNGGSSSSSDGGSGSYDCNICLELAQDPVVTHCGHLFCWPCLYRWLASRSSSCNECPVCKSAVEEAKVIPIYGRGKGSTDPRTKGVEIPHRPAGQRTDVPHRHSAAHAGAAASAFQQMGFSFFTGPSATTQFGNVTLGFGLFPFLFGFSTSGGGFPDLSFGGGGGGGQAVGGGGRGGGAATDGNGSPPVAAATNPQQEQERFLSKMLLFVGFFVLLCLCFF